MSKRISKSRYVNYRQCPKKLWLDVYHPEWADEMDQTVFKNGTMVGELAQDLFPNGALVVFDAENPKNIENMVQQTKELMQGGASVIYEAAFSHSGLLAICDILVKVKGVAGDRYDIYEVKSSTELKDVYIEDVAFQQYVLNLCGIDVRDTYIVHINNQYERQEALDIGKLFTIEPVTEAAVALQSEVEQSLPGVFALLESEEEYQCNIGLHCTDPYLCQFKSYCWSHIPEISVFNISRLGTKKKFECYENGVVTFEDIIKNNVPLNASQKLQIEAELHGIETIRVSEIKKFLSLLSYPLYFLDFETFMLPIPPFNATRPYQQIPSQYSLHYISCENGPLCHKEFLAKEGSDPRPDLAKQLLEDIPLDACILAYNMSFEKGIIRDLAVQFPSLCSKLMNIHDNIVDLMDPFKNKAYYTKEMRGRYSIKSVLPALFPDDPALSYEALGLIHDGGEAMNAYAGLLELPEEQRLLVRQSLLAYCKLDTLAMVKIWEKLQHTQAIK
ncbi:MAG: DUF2779 domain-containing protein [Clostridia bacterium]|nr:DUF2779 domain-containing protein [Clostridia bacterium]